MPVAQKGLLYLRLGTAACASVTHRRERLTGAGKQLKQGRRVKRFDVSRAQGQRLIDRLPPNVELRSLSVTEVAVPFFALGIPKLQAIGAGEIPSRARNWNLHFLVDRPRIAVSLGGLEIGRPGSLPGCSQRVRRVRKGVAEMLTADGETHRASW